MLSNYWDCYQSFYSQQRQHISASYMLEYCYCEGAFSNHISNFRPAPPSAADKIKSDGSNQNSTDWPIYKRVPTVILKQEPWFKPSEISSPIPHDCEDEDEPIIVKIQIDRDLNSVQHEALQDEIEEISELSHFRENSQRSKQIRKIKNIYWRKDVVVKTIIRSMRRFYSKGFKAFLKVIGYKDHRFWTSKMIIEGVSKLDNINYIIKLINVFLLFN